jgi:hypothetical protein
MSGGLGQGWLTSNSWEKSEGEKEEDFVENRYGVKPAVFL